jgi:hypothetical protein
VILHLDISMMAKSGSNSSADPLQKAAPPSPQFTESQQESSPDSPDRPENSPDSADGPSPEDLPKEKLPKEKLPEEELSPEKLSREEISLDATEPFPPDLFRLPVPNKVFSEMPSVSDSALRCLLALIHLSFRFDPAEDTWVHAGEWLSRSDVETECGLSCQGTRNGLSELENKGWTDVDRSGQGYRHRLALPVPDRRFTYVPTALLEGASELASATELRVVLAVLRGTWGWTDRETDPESGRKQTVHDRWTRLSAEDLAEATGRSTSAVKDAAKALQGRWVERVRPDSGPYQYRFLPEAIRDTLGEDPGEPPEENTEENAEDNTDVEGNADVEDRTDIEENAEEDGPACRATANDLAPDRQNSGPPSFKEKSLARDKHSQTSENGRGSQPEASPAATGDAVPVGFSSDRDRSGAEDQRRPGQESSPSGTRQRGPDFEDLPPEKQDLARKLSNVGVWAGRIADLLSRFSRGRIEANFQLYRQRAQEQTIRKPGAWLYEAITDGYALPNGDALPGAQPGQSEEGSAGGPGRMALPDHKETVSEAKKDAYLAQGVSEDRFHRCLSSSSPASEPQFMYFSPEEGGPERRV